MYRAERESDGQPVVLKLPQSEYPSSREIERLQHEYDIASLFDDDGIVRSLNIEEKDRRLCLVLEDFGGVPLRALIQDRPLATKEFLEFSIKIVESLAKVHSQNVIHKDIKPTNILVNAATGSVKLSDFGISSRLDRENANPADLGRFEGTLAYISPEQTGRMNRSVDYRTDFYSLGATLYEILTGRRVFESRDPLEIIHCHIARQPDAPETVVPGVPPVISRIVLKLMSKNAEDRYQSSTGLLWDLRECLRRLEKTGDIGDFEIGQHDVSEKFQLPQRLYGREKQIAEMLELFERTCEGACEILLVSGYSGIGKSALVNEVNKPIVARRGIFLAGKYDQFKRNIPYTALIEAFQKFLRQLLAEDEEIIRDWRRKLLKALGPNGRVMIDVIPEVEMIIGEQPPVPDLDPAEAQNRFNLVFKNFVQVFAQKEHPLVMFIDDLQWVDTPSLQLFRDLLLDTEGRYVYFIGAYRDNEVEESHPLVGWQRQLVKEGKDVREIHLTPLDAGDVNQLVADTLHCSLDRARPLSDLVRSKTLGNPFFVGQFLKTLYLQKLIVFDPTGPTWQWDMDQIHRTEITDNVVELMTERLQRLPRTTGDALRLAACVGNHFTLHTLAIIAERTPEESFADIEEALYSGLIYPTGEVRRELVQAGQSRRQNMTYRFLHDRVQQAAYSLIEEEHLREVHLRVGRLLLSHTPEDEIEEAVFEIVGHLRKGRELITDPDEKLGLVKLSVRAGNKARISTAYEPAVGYYRLGLELLPPDPYAAEYDLTMELKRELARCLYLTGGYDESEALLVELYEQARTVAEKALIEILRLTQYASQGRYAESIEVVKPVMALLEYPLPEKDGVAAALEREYRRIAELSGDRAIADLIDSPLITDPATQLAAVLLLMISVNCHFVGAIDLNEWCLARGMSLSLEHGNCEASGVIYANYAAFIGAARGLEGRYQEAYEYGKLGMNIVHKLNAKTLMAKTCMSYAAWIEPWMEPVENSFKTLREGFQTGVETGDLLYAGFNATFLVKHRIENGDPIMEVYEEEKSFIAFMARSGDLGNWNVHNALFNSLLALAGETPEPFELATEDWDEQKFIDDYMSDPTQSLWQCWYLGAQLPVLYLGGKIERALANIEKARSIPLEKVIYGQFQRVDYYFFAALTVLAAAETASEDRRNGYMEFFQECLGHMRCWVEQCYADSYLGRMHLMEAEEARVKGDFFRAAELYDRSIKASQSARLIQIEAIANYLAGKFYLERERPRLAALYLFDAHYLFNRWGAKAMGAKLAAEYPDLIRMFNPANANEDFSATMTMTHLPSSSTSSSSSSTSTGSFSRSTATAFDMSTVFKASQALSEEIVLDRLLSRMMEIVIENAGASKGVLLLEKEGRLLVEAVQRVDEEDVDLTGGVPLEESAEIAQRIVNYVYRSRKTVVLNDAAAEDSDFSEDPYILRNAPKSVLCLPLLHQGETRGILYLENGVAVRAFTPTRLEILKMLSNQIVISLENALLYDNLEQQVAERTAQLIEAEKMASLGGLVAGVAHEINTPLGIGVTAASTLLDETKQSHGNWHEGKLDEEEVSEYLDIALESSQLILSNLNKAAELVHSFKKVAVDQTSHERRSFNVMSYVEEILTSMKPRLQETGHRVTLDGDDTISMVSYPGPLSQVLTNLISNTLDHGYENGESGETRIFIESRGKSVHITYSDDGSGIKVENMERVFEPFFTTNRQAGGSGLGLHIVYNLVTQGLQGSIKLESPPGSGAIFRLELPTNVE